jgi:heme a synthase
MSTVSADRATLPPPALPLAFSAEEQRRRTRVAIWFWTGAALTFLILVIGGITRLTQSGLSIVDWNPIMGVIPPLNEMQWQEAFDRYREFPEYQQLRAGMSMDEFKFIFFWEYLHRVAARLVGIVFVVPFVVFWVKGYFDRKLASRALVLFALGGLQGFMGWYMVQSGLMDRPHVSHFRLAVHLSIAFTIVGCCIWFALNLQNRPASVRVSEGTRRVVLRSLAVFGALLGVQIFWGALVAGLKAGLYYNTFPLMGDSLIPPYFLGMDPWVVNLVENPITVQWLHRVIGTVLLLAAVQLWWTTRRSGVVDGLTTNLNHSLLMLMAAQYALGVLTILYSVPISLGVAHQAMAMILFGVWLVMLHRVKNWRPAARVQPA